MTAATAEELCHTASNPDVRCLRFSGKHSRLKTDKQLTDRNSSRFSKRFFINANVE